MSNPSLDIHIDRYGKIQLSTDLGNGIGYRIFGSKFQGDSKLLKRHSLTAGDCRELATLIRQTRRYLRKQEKAK